MRKCQETIEYCVAKFLSKYKTANPEKEPPAIKEVEEYIKLCRSKNQHITYPLAGQFWSEIDFKCSFEQGQKYVAAYDPSVHSTKQFHELSGKELEALLAPRFKKIYRDGK